MNDTQPHYINVLRKHNNSFSRSPAVRRRLYTRAYQNVKTGLNLEEALHVFPRSVVLHCGIRVLPHHVIDGCHDVQHLLKSQGEKTQTVTCK